MVVPWLTPNSRVGDAAKRKPMKKVRRSPPPVHSPQSPLTVRVRHSGGGYSVRAQGISASCTWSAATAVRRLGEKLGFKPGFDVVRKGAADGASDIWNIVEVQP